MSERVQHIFLLMLSALLLAIIVASRELELWAVLVFTGLHVWMLIVFALESDPVWYDWALVWAVIFGLGYMLFIVLMPKTVGLEFAGFILFLAYVGLTIAVAIQGKSFSMPAQPDVQVEDFRKKDDLDELIDSFEISKAPKDAEQLSAVSEDEIDVVEDAVEVYAPKAGRAEISYETSQEVEPIDVSGLKQDVDKMDTEVARLSEKIKKISEAAMVEPAKKDEKVYAAKNGEKYHKDRNCISLKRAEAVIAFDNSMEARKKGLKVCGMCR